jgi:hypothetical protein
MFRFRHSGSAEQPAGPRINPRLCTDRFNGKYPHVGIFDCRERKTWICKPLSGQAIRTSHARMITGAENAVSTVWKDRFLCFWFYTPNTGEGFIHGYPIDWDEAQLLVRIDPQWDYDRQRIIPPELTDQLDENIKRQCKHGDRIVDFFKAAKLEYPFHLHFIGQRATESLFYVRRVDGTEK